MFFAFYRHLLIPLSILILRALSPLLSNKMQALVKLRQARPWKQKLLPQNAIVVHASSGEIEYAKPVIKRLKEKNPEQKIILTYFSPSTLKLVKNISADALVPLPWDSQKEVGEFLDQLAPRALWISRTDLWPELLQQCNLRKIPTLLFSASFRTPTNFFSRRWKIWILDLLSEISFVSPEDQIDFERFNENLGLPGRTPLSFQDGNTRVDQVVERLKEKRILPLERFSTKPVIVLGSLWPEDIKVWLEVMQDPQVQDKFQWIWVPHEIDPDEIIKLRDQLLQISRSIEIWTDARLSKADHLIVNTVGFLAEIYKLGNLAFVGGSFQGKVHSLLEPLAAGLPVLVGPYYKNQPEAEAFARLELPGNLRAVTTFKTSSEMVSWLKALKLANHSHIILNRLSQDQGATDRLIQRHLAAPGLFSSTLSGASVITEE